MLHLVSSPAVQHPAQQKQVNNAVACDEATHANLSKNATKENVVVAKKVAAKEIIAIRRKSFSHFGGSSVDFPVFSC